MKKIINRPIYTERVAPFIGKNLIKVLTGQRRVGKSCLLQQLCDHIRQSRPEAKILFINKELSSFAHIRTSQDLLAEANKAFGSTKGSDCFLFVDEVADENTKARCPAHDKPVGNDEQRTCCSGNGISRQNHENVVDEFSHLFPRRLFDLKFHIFPCVLL